MPRYVILRHTGGPSGDHYDFMLEAGGVLKTWTIFSLDFDADQPATLNRDHRLEYLDYEGAISGDRGEVRREAAGAYELLARTPERLLVRLDERPPLLLRHVDSVHWTLGPG